MNEKQKNQNKNNFWIGFRRGGRLMPCIRLTTGFGYQITAIDPKTLREEEKHDER